MPASGSSRPGRAASRLTLTPPASLASCQPPRWPQPCGSATVPGVISSVTFTGTSTAPLARRAGTTCRRPRAGGRGVLGVDAQRVRAAAAHQQRRVVHPRVVRAQLAQADQPQRESPGRGRSPRPAGRPPAIGRARCTRLVVVRTRSGSTPVGIWSARTMPCGCARSLAERSARAAQAEQVAGRARCAAAGRPGAGASAARPGAPAPQRPGRCRGDADPARDLVDDLPLLARLARRRHDRVGDLDERLGVEAEERERHVVALEERGRAAGRSRRGGWSR